MKHGGSRCPLLLRRGARLAIVALEEKAMIVWQIAPCVETAPFGKSGRARGVENRRVGVGVELHAGHLDTLFHDVATTVRPCREELLLGETHAEQPRTTRSHGRARAGPVRCRRSERVSPESLMA